MNTQITNKSDMIGRLSLTIANNQLEDFNAIALSIQNSVSLELLGAELYNAFSANLDAGSGTPTEQKWLDLLNGVTWTDETIEDEPIVFNNRGLKEAWKYFTYYDYLDQAQFTSNFSGKGVKNMTNSTALDRQQLNAETQQRYNIGIDIYKTAFEFVCYYQEIEQDYTSISEVAGTYTVLLDSTKYLVDGDTITIDGNEYTVANLVADTSFEFTASTGLTFSNDYIKYEPFKDANLLDKGKIYFNGMF